MVGSAQGSLISSLERARHDLIAIARAGIEAAGAARALDRAFHDSALHARLKATTLHIIAAGKAAPHMMAAWMTRTELDSRSALAVGTHAGAALPVAVEWHEAGHPLPDTRSVAAAARALALARAVAADETLVLLLSGGASALLAQPLDGISLADKQAVVDAMLRGGADIHALNTVRKHISAVKGGRLAAACPGAVVTLAISDVVGDDLAVIGSGPGVPDPSTWADADRAFNRYVNLADQPISVRALIAKGLAGEWNDTPKADDPSMQRVQARVIASAADAVRGARAAAEQLGYRAVTLEQRVTGEARVAAGHWWRQASQHSDDGAPVCVISSGETTVRVRGTGRGGRNQEFALALADLIASNGMPVVAASVGTDGVDGPTDAAGAIVDATTMVRARKLGVSAAAHLDDNNSYAYFQQLGDLIVTGPTGTNVGDLQIMLGLGPV